MAENAGLLFWRAWALAAAVATAVPVVRLVAAPPPAPGAIRDRSKHGAERRAATGLATRPATIERAPEALDALLSALAKAETGPERCRLCEQLPAVADPRTTYAIAAVFERAHLKSVRACAAEALSRQPTSEARSWLVDLLDDSQPEVHRAALGALATAYDDAARALVIEATHSDNPELRLSAVSALLQARRAEGFEAAAVLLPSVEDRDALLTLVDALGASGDARAVPVLRDLLENGERETHLRAIVALGDLGSPLAVPALDELLARGSVEEFESAVQALRKLAPDTVFGKLRARLRSSNRYLALAALMGAKTPEVLSLMHEQLRADDEEAMGVVIVHLQRAPDASFETELTELASHAEAPLKHMAMEALRRLDTESARATLQRLEDRGDIAMRREHKLDRSILSLTRDPSEAAQAELSSLLEKSDVDPSSLRTAVSRASTSTVERVLARVDGFDRVHRYAVMSGLSRRGDPHFGAALRQALGDPDSQIRDLALRGLAELGDPSVAQDVTRLTHAGDANERSLAVDLLSSRSDDAATRELAALAGDADVEVASSALRALEPRSPELALQLALRAFRAGSTEERLTMLGNASFSRQSVTRPLNELALTDADDGVAIAAAQSLTTLEGPASAERLLAVASDANRSAEVRSAAAQGLRQLGGPLARSNRALLDSLNPVDDSGSYVCNQ